MSDKACQQAESVADLKARDAGLQKTLDELWAGQRRFIEVLEGIAAQGEQIKTLFHRQTDMERGIDELFRRSRSMELDVVSLQEFRKNHDLIDQRSTQVSAPVKAGLIVGTILAVVAFGLWVMDRSNYLQKALPPAAMERKDKYGQD